MSDLPESGHVGYFDGARWIGSNDDRMTVWRNVHVGFEGDDLKIGGLDVWKHTWRSAGIEPLNLPHPSYPSQIHRYIIYDIGDERGAVRFAAAELSNGVWGFYVPTQ